MSPPGRSKGEYRGAKPEGASPGRPHWPPEVSPVLCEAIDRLLRREGWPDGGELGVGLSGGPDSAMLALHAAAVAAREGRPLHCLHVHHGLHAQADGWLARAAALAARLGAGFHPIEVEVDLASGKGLEGAAREARYRALARLAARAGVSRVLLAHHQDDQAETVLLRLLRGAGPEGLAAMADARRRDGLTYLRPWLDVPRAGILAQAERYAAQSGWRPVSDPSNLDTAHARGVLRRQLAPAIETHWPAWRSTLARHARQAAAQREVLDEVAAQDLAALDPAPDGRSFDLRAWRALSPARQALVLRHWLAGLGLRAASDARLAEFMRQLRQVHAHGHDRQLTLRHDGAVLCCVRGRVAAQTMPS